MKLLLYCTKAKPFLINDCGKFYLDNKGYNYYWKKGMVALEHLNGKIVAECDFEVEKITYRETDKNNYSFGTETLTPDELLNKSCLTILELCKYIGSNKNWIKGDYGYAIHIKNLHIFDEPKELDYCYVKSNTKGIYASELMIDGEWHKTVDKAPQNMMMVKRVLQEDGVLIPIRPKRLCKILNGEETIELRKKVLKEMFNDKQRSKSLFKQTDCNV